MKIGQFTTQYPYPQGPSAIDDYFCAGAERVVKNLTETLDKNGIQVHVFTSAKSASYTTTNHNGIQIHRSPSVTSIRTAEIAPTLLFDPLIRGPSSLDLVHAHSSTPPGVAAAYTYSKVTDTPMIVTHHGGENYNTRKGLVRDIGLRFYMDHFLEEVFNHANAITVPAEGYIKESQTLSNTTTDIHHIPNGIDSSLREKTNSKQEAKEELGIPDSKFVYLFMAIHYPRKGPDVLLDAFADLQQNQPDMQLIIAGSGEITSNLQHRADKLGIDDVVQFPGYIPEADKTTYLTAADAYVLPSTIPASEMFPLSILEAGACGTPVITSNYPALRSIVQEYDCGLLAEPDDPDDLKEVMAELYDDAELLSELSASASTMSRRLSWKAVSQRYRFLYQLILDNK